MLIKLSGKIATENNLYTIVDDIDSDLTLHKWFAAKGGLSYYASRANKGHKGASQGLHRTVIERVLQRSLTKAEEVDHINGDSLDNRRDNLRVCTHQQNMWNRGKPANNTSGYLGVIKRKGEERVIWAAQIRFNKKCISKSGFRSAEEAALYHDELAKKYHGEFARLNFPNGFVLDTSEPIKDEVISKKRVFLRLPLDLVEKLKQEQSQAVLVERLLREHYGL